MNRSSFVLASALAGISLFLAGCGFQLRGSTNIPFKTFYIGVNDTSSLAVVLKRNIRGNGPTQLVSDPNQAEARLEILGETHDTQLLTINSAGLAVEYYLDTKIRFRVTNGKGKEFIPPTEIAVRRIIKVNSNAVLAQQFEVDQLYRDSEADAAQQILRRIEAIHPEQ